jgi:hypothetical protein
MTERHDFQAELENLWMAMREEWKMEEGNRNTSTESCGVGIITNITPFHFVNCLILHSSKHFFTHQNILANLNIKPLEIFHSTTHTLIKRKP